MFPTTLNLTNESLFFLENFSNVNDCVILSDLNHFFYLSDYSNYSSLKFFNKSNLHTKSLITYINQLDDISLFNNLENVTSVYHYSIPNVKLSYPEPFIASPSFMHSDL